MQRIITHKVDSHAVNPNYQCLVYNLLRDDNFHFHIVGGYLARADWMPREDDVLDITEDLLKVSPTFGPRLLTLALSIPFPTVDKPKKKIENLAEVLE